MDTDINNFGRKSFVTWTAADLKAEKENQMRPLKFRQPRLDNNGNFIDWFYWGFIDDGFIAPLRLDIDNYQFTLRHDKNKKEIYDGDIAKFYHNGERFIGKIFQTVTGEWVISAGTVGVTTDLYYGRDQKEIEVIGNIHQNPKLMEHDNGS